MVVTKVPIGARGTDSVQAIDADHAAEIKAKGYEFVVRYLHSITAEELRGIVAAGLGFMPVTFADRWNAQDALLQCQAIALPPGCTVWLDVEGKDLLQGDVMKWATLIDSWAVAISPVYMPGGYFGNPQPFTSEELYKRRVVRYWRGQGRCIDRCGELAEPSIVTANGVRGGWNMVQSWPSQMVAGIWADINFAMTDYELRPLMMAVA